MTGRVYMAHKQIQIGFDGLMNAKRHDKPRRFQAIWFFVGWDCISLGGHVCWSLPNVEIHLPFSFIRVGWQKDPWFGDGQDD